MLLYLVHDLEKSTYSYPIVGENLPTIIQSLEVLNPENLHSLSIIPLIDFSSIPHLISLINDKIKSHEPIYIQRSAEVTSSATQASEARLESILKET